MKLVATPRQGEKMDLNKYPPAPTPPQTRSVKISFLDLLFFREPATKPPPKTKSYRDGALLPENLNPPPMLAVPKAAPKPSPKSPEQRTEKMSKLHSKNQVIEMVTRRTIFVKPDTIEPGSNGFAEVCKGQWVTVELCSGGLVIDTSDRGMGIPFCATHALVNIIQTFQEEELNFKVNGLVGDAENTYVSTHLSSESGHEFITGQPFTNMNDVVENIRDAGYDTRPCVISASHAFIDLAEKSKIEAPLNPVKPSVQNPPRRR